MTVIGEKGKERLKILADFLEKVKEEQFNITTWFDYEKMHELTGEEISPSDLEKIKDCGFAGCAIGWATRIPQFNKEGFSFTKYDSPYYQGEEDFGAVEKFFEIDFETSSHLFLGSGYDLGPEVTPKMVSEKIRKFLEEAVVE